MIRTLIPYVDTAVYPLNIIVIGFLVTNYSLSLSFNLQAYVEVYFEKDLDGSAHLIKMAMVCMTLIWTVPG